jgi:DnaJ homolog subfamily C member 28
MKMSWHVEGGAAMADEQRKDESQQDAQRPAGRGRRVWRDLVEEILGEARENGEFDNLPGKGKPLRLQDDVYAGDKALAYHLLKNNDMAPPEIERGRQIDAELARAEEILATLRRRRSALLGGGRVPSASDRRAYNLVRDNAEASYREVLREANSNVLSLNITAPAILHRPLISVEKRMQAFMEEFARLEE